MSPREEQPPNQSALRTYSIYSLLAFDTDIASAAEALTQLAPHAVVRCLVGQHELRFALTAEVFLAGFHRTVTGRDGHWAKLDAATALLAEIGPDAERVVHMTLFAPPDKANRPGFPDLRAHLHTASAQNTVIVPKWIPDLLNPTAQGNILNGTGVRGLGHQQLREVTTQPTDFVRICQYHHPLFYVQGAGSSNIGASIDYMLNNAQSARTDTREIGYVTQMGNADTVFNRRIENGGPPGRPNIGSVYINIDLL